HDSLPSGSTLASGTGALERHGLLAGRHVRRWARMEREDGGLTDMAVRRDQLADAVWWRGGAGHGDDRSQPAHRVRLATPYRGRGVARAGVVRLALVAGQSVFELRAQVRARRVSAGFGGNNEVPSLTRRVSV